MKYCSCAVGLCALIFAALTLFAPAVGHAALGIPVDLKSVYAASYCIVPEAQSYRRPLPIFGNSSSCATWIPISLPATTGRSYELSFSPAGVDDLPPGLHTLYLRFQDAAMVWGPPRKQQFRVVTPEAAPKAVSAATYFLDVDGNPTDGTPLPPGDLLGKTGIPLSLASSLPAGKHTLYLHLQDSSGFWGPARRYSFWVEAKPTAKLGRYFITPPDTLPAGYLASLTPSAAPDLTGIGRSLDGSFGATTVDASAQLSQPPALDFGAHTFYTLFQDSKGSWSQGWQDPAARPELQSTVYVGNQLTIAVSDSDGTHAGRDGSVSVSSPLWPSTGYTTPTKTCTSLTNDCTEIYANGALLTLTPSFKPWIQRPLWSGCYAQADGSCLVTMDGAKNVTLQFVDAVAPDTVITGKPAVLTNLSAASFAFALPPASAEDGAMLSYQCSLDGNPASDASFTACSSPRNLTGLSDGIHTFYVRAVDKASNKDATPGSYTWTVDTTPPDTTISGKPVTPTKSTAASFSFSSTEANSSFECKLDGGSFGACPGTAAYSALAEGVHDFQVRAIDPATNIDPTPASYSWSVDLAPPETTITSHPVGISNSAGASFGFLSSETGSSFECRLDGGAFAPCTTPATYAALAEGSHSFQVRATDLATNVDPTPASFGWSVDTIPPDTTILAKPAANAASKSASFGFSSNEANSSFECRLDSGAFAACSSPAAYTSLAEGSHSFQVRASDQATNSDPTPASYSWTVDTVAPDTAIGSKPPVYTVSTAASFSFSSGEANTSFECKLDGGAFAACTSPLSYPVLAEGSHSFQVRAIDLAGNADPTPAGYSWNIDLTPPNTGFISRPLNPSNVAAPSFTFSSNEADSNFECQLDGGAFAACPNPKTCPNLAEGSHTFQVRAIDQAGNVDPTPASYTWSVDLTPPDTVITAQPASLSTSRAPSFSFGSSELNSSFVCALDGGTFAVCAAPLSYTGLSDGSHSFQVRAIDPAGNVDPSPASYSWTVDATAPTVVFTVPANNTSLTVSFTRLDAGDAVGYLVNETGIVPLVGGPGWSTTAPRDYTFLNAGDHTLYAFAKDSAGNVSLPVPAPLNITLTLTVYTAGTGSGTVNSVPDGIACASGPISTGCSSKSLTGGTVKLSASPTAGSTFDSWSGVCSGTGSCSIPLTSSVSATATFTLAPLLKIGNKPYSTLQNAYDATLSGATIMMEEGGAVSGGLVANRDIAVLIRGGYRADYGTVDGTTSVAGKISLNRGTLRVEGIYLK